MYEIIQEQSNPQIQTLNEMLVRVQDSLPKETELSIYYNKLKHLLHSEVINFCKEQVELKQDLNFFRMSVGTVMTEKEIREYLDSLKEKYNGHYHNVGIDYHVEVTRYDYGVPVFCIIKRSEIYMKKFVFRFRKATVSETMDGLSLSGVPFNPPKEDKK